MKVMRNIIERGFICVLSVAIVLLFQSSYAGDLTIDGDFIVTSNLTVKGAVDVSSNRITNVATPANDTDAATKAYVDAANASNWSTNALGNGKITGSLDIGSDMTIGGEVTMERVVLGLPAVPTNGLILHYNFNELEEGGIVTDLSGAGNTGTVHGTIQVTDGVIDGAYAFDGVTSHIVIKNGTVAEIPEQQNYSVSVWFLNNGGGDWTGYGQKIVDKTVWYHDFHLCVFPDGTLLFWTYETGPIFHGGAVSDGSHDYRDGAWHHAVVVVKEGNCGELWVDGELKNSATNIQQVYSTGDMMVGYSGSGDHWQRKHWSGDIDELRMYERALTAEEARSLYLMGSPAAVVNGSIAMSGNSITGLADPVNDQDAATKAYVDTTVGSSVFSGSFNDLKDVPAGLADGDDDSKWNGSAMGLNAETGRASLGLGSAATKEVSAFAPAELATHVPPQGNLSMGIYTNRPSI